MKHWLKMWNYSSTIDTSSASDETSDFITNEFKGGFI